MLFIASSGLGGAESVVVNLANSLVCQDEVFIVAFKDSPWVRNLSEKIKVITLSSSEQWFDPRLYLGLYRAIKKLKPDVVHSHGAKGSRLIKRLSRLTPLVQVATKHNSRKGRIFNSLPFVTAVSAKVASSIRQPVQVIYNGVVRSSCFASTIPDEAFSILAVGRLDPIKRFDWLIREVSTLQFPYRLTIVGDGPQRAELNEIIDELGLKEKVLLAGQRDDVPRMMASNHLVVISSRSEGFSLVMAEAFFYANLFLSTPVGAAEELLPEEFLIREGELFDSVQRAQADYGRYSANFRKWCDERSESFGMGAVAEQYRQVYYRSCRIGEP